MMNINFDLKDISAQESYSVKVSWSKLPLIIWYDEDKESFIVTNGDLLGVLAEELLELYYLLNIMNRKVKYDKWQKDIISKLELDEVFDGWRN